AQHFLLESIDNPEKHLPTNKLALHILQSETISFLDYKEAEEVILKSSSIWIQKPIQHHKQFQLQVQTQESFCNTATCQKHQASIKVRAVNKVWQEAQSTSHIYLTKP